VVASAKAKTRNNDSLLLSTRSRLSATRSLTSAKLITIAFFARASHARTYWRCCEVGLEVGTGGAHSALPI
jgi:hypothetical protein